MQKEVKVNRYRRIEVKAFNRRVTIVSGEWPRHSSSAKLRHPEDVLLEGTGLCEPVEADSPEGQMILVEAVRSLERRLSPEARATICSLDHTLALNHSIRNVFYLKLQSLYRLISPRARHLLEGETKNGSRPLQKNRVNPFINYLGGDSK